MSKYRVTREHRTCDLSDHESKLEVELYYGDHSRVYENIHYPESFIRKAFEKNPDIIKAVIIDLENNKRHEVLRDGV